jgi:hypothetical protein
LPVAKPSSKIRFSTWRAADRLGGRVVVVVLMLASLASYLIRSFIGSIVTP